MIDSKVFLSSMTEAYGQEPDERDSLILGLLASELSALSAGFDRYEIQAFPETAQGEYLDRHGELFGIKRLEAAKASGDLIFSRNDGLGYELSISKGTVCSDGGELEYITTEDVRMDKSTSSVSVAAEAVSGGAKYNIAKNKINTMVTVPMGVESVTNLSPFTGGADSETDSSLRKRIMKLLSAFGSYNCEYYSRRALDFPGVSSARAKADGSGNLKLYVRGAGKDVSDALLREISSTLSKEREINVNIEVLKSQEYSYNCTVYVAPAEGTSFAHASEVCRKVITDYFSAIGTGDTVYLAEIITRLMENAPIKSCDFAATVKNLKVEPSVIPVLASLNILEIL